MSWTPKVGQNQQGVFVMKWTYEQKVKWVKDHIEKGFTPRIIGVSYEHLHI